ncbi:hypothetical protein HMPREF9130_0389 [Peptoniphilus sp. oral taxon 375 str. F0436]|nr:hypothetical protein HMPREF9130_0389 [Peptoniphilus sp. oral taxon 375 str. F0436]
MQAIRSICIRVTSDNVITVPKDEIWKVAGYVNSKEKASEYDISTSNFNSRDRQSTILGGGIRLKVDGGSQYDDPKVLTGIAFKL